MRTTVRQLIFNLTIHGVGRALEARDLAVGWAKLNWHIDPGAGGVSRHQIASGRNKLDAVLVKPASSPPRAGLLICHGIGETVQRWHGVQQLLAANGIASLVFDYAGYGRSTGVFGAKRSERDAIAAFEFLREQLPSLPVSLLGFSLGSGVAAAILPRVEARSLLLCAAYTSIRDAAHSVGMPRWMTHGVPPIWRAEDVLRVCEVPVFIVHGDKDRLFPTAMAKQLNECCNSSAEMVLVPQLTHNEPFHRPTMAYWGLIVAHLLHLADRRPQSRHR